LNSDAAGKQEEEEEELRGVFPEPLWLGAW